MKKLILIFFTMILAFTALSQDPLEGKVDAYATLDYENQSFFFYEDIDAISGTDSVWTRVLRVKSEFQCQPSVFWSIDSTGGTADTVEYNLYSKLAPSQGWIKRETQTVATGVDSTFLLESDSAHTMEYIKLEMKSYSSGFSQSILELMLKNAKK